MTVYGYCRISTAKQNIERQERNIKEYDSNAIILKESYTGTDMERPLFTKLLKQVRKGDTIIFDSVSRMSRTALNNSIELTGNQIADVYIQATNSVLMMLAEEQIRLAFVQSEKEVQDLRDRTREGIVTAKLNGKQIGRMQGSKIVTKKSIECKRKIVKYSRKFGGTLSDTDVIKLLSISRNSFYKYCRELKEIDC